MSSLGILVTSGVKVLDVLGMTSLITVMTVSLLSPPLMTGTFPKGAMVEVISVVMDTGKSLGGVAVMVAPSNEAVISECDVMVVSWRDVRSSSFSPALTVMSSDNSVIPVMFVGDVVVLISIGETVVMVDILSPGDINVEIVLRSGVDVVVRIVASFGDVMEMLSSSGIMVSSGNTGIVVPSMRVLLIVVESCGGGDAVVVVVVAFLGGGVVLTFLDGVVVVTVVEVEATSLGSVGMVAEVVLETLGGGVVTLAADAVEGEAGKAGVVG